MKTLVMFEAFGKKLKSEPEIWTDPGRTIRMPLPINSTLVKEFDPNKIPSSLSFKAATFEFVEQRYLTDWEFPIKVYRLVDV